MSNDLNETELRRLDLNLLLAFAALMRERSVSRAASRLRIGASAMSMALGRLRGVMGDDLFVRMGSGMQPTPRAEALWVQLGPALTSIQQAMRDVRGFDPMKSDLVVRFAAPDDLEFVLIPELMARLERQAPFMRLIVRPSNFRTLVGALDSGDADVALSATPESGLESRHRVQPLHRDTFAVLFDPAMIGHPGPLDLETYLSVSHFLLSPSGDLHGPIDERLAEIGRTRVVTAALSHFATMPFLLKRRRAIVNMPSIAAGFYATAYDLAVCLPPVATPDFEVALIWHVRTDSDPAHAWFRHLVSELVIAFSGDKALK